MDLMELNRDITRLRRDDQYLKNIKLGSNCQTQKKISHGDTWSLGQGKLDSIEFDPNCDSIPILESLRHNLTETRELRSRPIFGYY